MKHKGFTVLELLIVIGIITVLISLVLVGLNSTRKHSSDERKVSNVQTIVVGLVEYFNICREYPADISGRATCPDLRGKTLKDLIPDIGIYASNHAYLYAGLADSQSPDICSGFHIGVTLEAGDAAFHNKSGAAPSGTCHQSGQDFAGNVTTVFDIKK